ncbi:MAG TPA: PLP-dependent aminotransferase family protein [Gaiellaceae bacterium]
MATISFARGVPAPELLPVEELADCARAAIERDGRTVLNYGPVAGYAPLREWVAARHGVEPEQVLLTNGSLQGLSLLAALLLERGSRVLVEGPTYDRALYIAARHEAEPVPVPMDEEGLDPDALELPAAFLYTIPTFQNPSGRTLSLDRRRRLAELAANGELLIVEDDPYALVRFGGEALPSIYELAGGEGVVYSHSFSKIVSPGLRVGYLVGPAELIGALEAIAVQTYLTPSLVSQATVFEFLRRGLLEANVERVAGALRERRDAMLETFEQEMPDGARWSRPEGGYFIWLDLPPRTDAAALLARAEREGVTFVKGTDFFPPGQGGSDSARLAYSFVSSTEVRAGVARLAGLLRELRSAPVAV